MQKITSCKFNQIGKRIGESHGRARLSDADIHCIRLLFGHGVPARELAEAFNITVGYLYKVLRYDARWA